MEVYAAKNPDEEIRMQSSSGGIFTMLAEKTIAEGGVVFGARFNEQWNVIHDFAETIEGIAAFRGSKYVQSRIGDTYKQAEMFLKQGREVLFSGTPCQIAGLKLFLHKDYENLFAVDVVCHGVPSPLVWQEYLKRVMRPEGADGENTVLSSLNGIPLITGIAFRDKRLGWRKYGFEIRKSALEADKNSVLKSGINQEKAFLFEPLTENVYMQGFLHNLYLRPSCHACPARQGKSGSDLTIADYWGIARWLPEFDDDKGVGLVLINSKKGASVYSDLKVDALETSYEQALAGNPCIEHSVAIPKSRAEFWRRFPDEGVDVIAPICRKMRPGLIRRGLSLGKKIAKRIIRRK